MEKQNFIKKKKFKLIKSIYIVLVPSANGTSNAGQQQPQQAGQMQAAVQPDYSKQWAEYYRSIGRIEEAEAIENQIKATKVCTAYNIK